MAVINNEVISLADKLVPEYRKIISINDFLRLLVDYDEKTIIDVLDDGVKVAYNRHIRAAAIKEAKQLLCVNE